MENSQRKMSMWGLVLMIFAAIYGLGNTTVGFYQMGYGAMLWYVLGALLFFIPSSLMFAEYGSALKDSQGGIYSWLQASIGEKPAFIGAFIWYAAWVIWLVTNFSTISVSISGAIFGKDTTQAWHLFGLTSNQTLGLIGIALLVFATFVSTRGFDKIEKIASFCGTFIIGVAIFFLIVSAIYLMVVHGHLAQSLTTQSMVKSPNPAFGSPIALMSFFVYAVFAYGGMETMGSTIDKVKDPDKNFPRGIVIAAIGMIVIYCVGVLAWGVTANWHRVLSGSNVDLGNITLVLMSNLGYSIAHTLFHTSVATAKIWGLWADRIIGIEEILSIFGAIFILIYSPLKTMIIGTPQRLWPSKLTKLNEHGMPATAMWCQTVMVVLIILGVSFGGKSAQAFYTVLQDMNNVTTSVPYLFLIAAFPFFKKRQDLERPFEIYTNRSLTVAVSFISWITIFMGIVFTVVQPLLQHDFYTAFWTVFGPVFFGIAGWCFYSLAGYRQRHRVNAGVPVTEELNNN